VKPGEIFIVRVATQKQEKLGHFQIFAAGAAEEATPITALPADPADHLAAPFGTARLAPGAYLAAVSDGTGKRLASVPFWITDPAAKPGLRWLRLESGRRSDRGVVEQRARQQVRLDRDLLRG
jgi:hypothetical protein